MKAIAHGTACSMFNGMHHAPVQLTIRSLSQHATGHVWLERQFTRKTRRTSFTHEASARPLSTMRRLKKPTATRIYAQITRKYSMYFHHKDPEMANMLINTSSACVSDTSLTYTLQLAVQICEANCCACNADVRMAAALVEFDCETTCPTT
jgi:hypothetical protein